MTLDPDRYECPDHQIDVTDLVKEKLNPDRPDVAFRRPLLGRRAKGPEPFEVIVACPGAGGAEPHLLTCTGTQTP
jgi:hypothetical protein